jgi:hypothetical protein
MTQEIRLSQGKVAIVDDADYELVGGHKWSALRRRGGRYYYAIRGINGRSVAMHRLIMDAPPALFVDHINGDGLDNRRANLRLCTNAQNLWNSKRSSSNKTGFRGVCLDTQNRLYRAYINANGKRIYLGYYHLPEDAAIARDRACSELHGEFARLNVVT